MTRPLTDREERIIRETPELRWPEDAFTEATHRAGQSPSGWFAGPRQDLVSVVPWERARFRQWTILPHGVAARLVRESRGKSHDR